MRERNYLPFARSWGNLLPALATGAWHLSRHRNIPPKERLDHLKTSAHLAENVLVKITTRQKRAYT
jgi:hypothetical protein